LPFFGTAKTASQFLPASAQGQSSSCYQPQLAAYSSPVACSHSFQQHKADFGCCPAHQSAAPAFRSICTASVALHIHTARHCSLSVQLANCVSCQLSQMASQKGSPTAYTSCVRPRLSSITGELNRELPPQPRRVVGRKVSQQIASPSNLKRGGSSTSQQTPL